MMPPDFPAGTYAPEPNPTSARRAELIAEIERLPARVHELIAGLNAVQIGSRYKNWTVRQIVHHLADSHMNAFVRFRLTLTEEKPTIKPYDETRWAELPDTKTADAMLSVRLLEALHARWALLLRAMSDADFERSYLHPEYQKEFRLAEALGLYAHHCRHHTAQIAWVRDAKE
jgi:DinB superfamily